MLFFKEIYVIGTVIFLVYKMLVFIAINLLLHYLNLQSLILIQIIHFVCYSGRIFLVGLYLFIRYSDYWSQLRAVHSRPLYIYTTNVHLRTVGDR